MLRMTPTMKAVARLATWTNCLVHVRIRHDTEGFTEVLTAIYEDAIQLGRTHYMIFRDADEHHRIVSADSILEMCDLPDPGIEAAPAAGGRS